MNLKSRMLVAKIGDEKVYAPIGNCVFCKSRDDIFCEVKSFGFDWRKSLIDVSENEILIADLKCNTFEELMVALDVHMLIHNNSFNISGSSQELLGQQSNEIMKLKEKNTLLENQLALYKKNITQLFENFNNS